MHISPSHHSDILEQSLSMHWVELLRLRLVVMEHFRDSDIHDLRVASRRVRAALDMMGFCMRLQGSGQLTFAVRKLTRELGELRNLDEALGYMRHLHDDGLSSLIGTLEKNRCREVRRIRRLLEAFPVKRLGTSPHEKEDISPSECAISSELALFLHELNIALYYPIHSLLQAPGLEQLVRERHALRIAIKKWRYFNELITSLCGSSEDGLLALLKKYQSLLGDLNDREIFIAMVRNAKGLTLEVRDRVLTVISGQHSRMAAEFRILLKQRPLRYQFRL